MTIPMTGHGPRAIRLAVLACTALSVAGCASSLRRMPPAAAMAAPPAIAPLYAPPITPVTPDFTPPAYATPVYQPLPPVAAAPPPPVTGITGLTERQPDLCGASQQASAIGQPGSVVPTLGLTKPFRIVEYRGIEPQDYNPNRMVFRLDAAGTITKIDCG